FRVAYGGAQELFDVHPDLTCLGKIIGGGFPVGAYGGKKEIMDLIAPVGPVYQAGTLSGNPVAMTAGLETLKVLKETGTYERLDALSETFAKGVQEAAKDAGIPVFQTRVGSMLGLFFTDEQVFDFKSAKKSNTEQYAKYFHELLARGHYIAPSQFEALFLSLAHDEDVIAETLSGISEALRHV
nr:aminotransferase class III-fold pyridoxal phosphate-dependent enzyme [candidate division KSB1 bacterium]NIR68754.1 aminotransferase class III-fold pyridoxal phosphate-dependent enzyme [candidate division KSB1 bacterium]NIS25570.1 aminotransferase class III-fold pyridoxal phosphate-dependent enzyme [candidate division KSB1 bacterium]NIT72464.1 aminotransferase class III-fold pyridoxal phosphate-dependent enzyme [candidate division KSB1 bacterium]NIU26248.1 aminotransferase class III-fold pyri